MTDDVRSKLAALRQLPTANLSDALDRIGIIGSMSGVKIMDLGMGRMAGLARTIQQAPRRGGGRADQLYVRHIEMADDLVGADEVIVIGVVGNVTASSWGHLLSLRSKMRGAAGTITDGTVRDPKEIIELGYPVFSGGGVCVTGSKLRLETISVDEPIVCGGIHVRPGDVVVGDDSGVVVIPPAFVDDVISIAQEISASEEETARRILAGGPLRKPAAR